MTEKALRLGTRRSKLAMAQSGQVADAVSQVTGRPVELVEITTYGDTSREHLAQIGGTGVFVAALRDALLRGEVDFAVHSLKDLPTTPHDDLVVAAIPEREDPRDVVVARDARKLTDLPRGARRDVAAPVTPCAVPALRPPRPSARPAARRSCAAQRSLPDAVPAA